MRYAGRRAPKNRYAIGDKVYIYNQGKKHPVTFTQYRGKEYGWHYRVDGKWRAENSIRKRRK